MYRIGWRESERSLYVTVRAESAVEAKELAKKVAKRGLGSRFEVARVPETKGPSVGDLFRNGELLWQLKERNADPEWVHQQIRRLDALRATLQMFLEWYHPAVARETRKESGA